MTTPPVAGLALASAAVMALAQIAVPLTPEGDRAGLTTVVVAAFAATTTILAADRWGWRRAAVAAGVVVGATTALERVGTSTGWPFGDYRYTGALVPAVAGVPLAVPLAWWAMAVPAREVAGRLTRRPGWTRLALGALALTAWDVMLDPQMVEEGYWVWDGGGPWREVPLTNYAGWLVASVVVMATLDRLLPPAGPDTSLLALYTWWAVMQTLGFVAFFGDPVVGLVGGLSMGLLAGLAWAGSRNRRSVAAARRG